MILHNFFDEREADAAAFLSPRFAQALKNEEYLFLVFGAKTDTVIAYDDFTIVHFWGKRRIFFDILSRKSA